MIRVFLFLKNQGRLCELCSFSNLKSFDDCCLTKQISDFHCSNSLRNLIDQIGLNQNDCYLIALEFASAWASLVSLSASFLWASSDCWGNNLSKLFVHENGLMHWCECPQMQSLSSSPYHTIWHLLKTQINFQLSITIGMFVMLQQDTHTKWIVRSDLTLLLLVKSKIVKSRLTKCEWFTKLTLTLLIKYIQMLLT